MHYKKDYLHGHSTQHLAWHKSDAYKELMELVGPL